MKIRTTIFLKIISISPAIGLVPLYFLWTFSKFNFANVLIASGISKDAEISLPNEIHSFVFISLAITLCLLFPAIIAFFGIFFTGYSKRKDAFFEEIGILFNPFDAFCNSFIEFIT
jgi:hypothetical protein